jgi:hypothetical protein
LCPDVTSTIDQILRASGEPLMCVCLCTDWWCLSGVVWWRVVVSVWCPSGVRLVSVWWLWLSVAVAVQCDGCPNILLRKKFQNLPGNSHLGMAAYIDRSKRRKEKHKSLMCKE